MVKTDVSSSGAILSKSPGSFASSRSSRYAMSCAARGSYAAVSSACATARWFGASPACPAKAANEPWPSSSATLVGP